MRIRNSGRLTTERSPTGVKKKHTQIMAFRRACPSKGPPSILGNKADIPPGNDKGNVKAEEKKLQERAGKENNWSHRLSQGSFNK